MTSLRFGLLLAALALLPGCSNNPPAPAKAAAEKPRAEGELARTTISRAARDSLGIRTVPVRVEPVQEMRTLVGWIIPRPGNEVVVTAPLAGYLRAPAAPAKIPGPGLPVKQGQELFRLEPVLSPLEQVQLASLQRGIESDLAKAKENATFAEADLKRAQSLGNLRGQRDLEQAQVAVKVAREDLAAAEDKLRVIAGPNRTKGDFQPPPLALKAPRAGVTLLVPANPGQFVAAAAPLATIADLSDPWVRVPVPEYELPRIDPKGSAKVMILPPADRRDTGKGKPVEAKPVALVPQVDPLKHTADLMYELKLEKTGDELPIVSKDEMVQVAVPVGGRAQESVVPYSALYADAYGGWWLYLDRTPSADADLCIYERVRVELGPPLAKDEVVVRPALKAGDRVVSSGVAALFSREFYRPPVVVAPVEKAK